MSKNINERCPLSGECERKKCEFRFKENECSYYIGNARPDLEIEGMEVTADILDLFNSEGERREIEYIDIDLIHPHPDNPRKDVGDVSELAESIKHSGIMQNLTVVPFYDEYRVIIGHRRLAASKLAGLTEVPCVVVEMSEKEQLGVMLCENMQRVDLTIVEQAQGMQLMLDMGDTVPDIAEKTGLSKATVGKRIKLNALPVDKLKEAEGRGGTLEEYLKCLEIEDEKARENLLDAVGTKDFKWHYDTSLRAQKFKKNIVVIEAMCKEHGIQPFKNPLDRYSSKYEHVIGFDVPSWEKTDFREKLKKKTKYFYFAMENSSIYIYALVEKKKSAGPKKSEKEIEAERRRKELKELFKRAYGLREEFILSFTETKTYEKVILEYLIKFEIGTICSYASRTVQAIKKAIGDDSERYYPERQKFDAFAEKNPGYTLLLLAHYNTGDTENICCYQQNWGEEYPSYVKNSALERIYEFLGKLGYQISTEEQKLLDGTHELYEKE